jgi:hypothetical protein
MVRRDVLEQRVELGQPGLRLREVGVGRSRCERAEQVAQLGHRLAARVRSTRCDLVDHLDQADLLDHRPHRGQVAEPFVLAAHRRGGRPAGEFLGDLRGAAQVLLRHDPGLAVDSGRLDQVVVDPAVRPPFLDHRRHMWVIHDLDCEVGRHLAGLILGPDPDAPAAPPDRVRQGAISRALLLTVHPDQPLGRGWLRNLLAPMAMADRDRRWTAQLRGLNQSRRLEPSPYRPLLDWARSAPAEVLKVGVDGTTTVAHLTAEALAWALPSPDRFLRDAATRAIVATTAHDPHIVAGLLQY